MLVSFIIPAYNAADTIVRCLESIYGLSLKPSEFEVIVIDDCSIDETVSIIEDFKFQVSNLTLLKQPKNNRQGAARNRGVSVARGEYICFVDADDAVTEGIVHAIRSAVENKTDMTAYHYAFVNETEGTTKEANRLSFEEGELFSGIEMQNCHPYWCSGPVAYVYNRAFLERANYPFVEGVLFEDSDFVAVHLFHAERMTYFSELGYKAYYREGSTTHHTSYKSVADYLLLGVRMLRFYESIKSEGVNELTNEREKFAEKILEGACYNVAKSCKRLTRLSRIEDVRAFYDRIDATINRGDLLHDRRIKRYYWNAWTRLCLKHKNVTMSLLVCLIPMCKLIKR